MSAPAKTYPAGRLRRMSWSRLNYILIPQSRQTLERAERSWLARALAPVAWFMTAFSAEGHALMLIGYLSAAMSIDVGRTSGYILWSALTGLLVAAFLLRFGYRIRDAELSLEYPPRITAQDPLPVTLHVRNTGTRPLEAIRTSYTMLSWDGRWIDPRPSIDFVAPGGHASVVRHCTFTTRGEKFPGRIRANLLVPGGLTVGPHCSAGSPRVIVVPRPAQVVEVDTGSIASDTPSNESRHVHTGDSEELIGVRPWRPGDPLRGLHIPTWRRTGEPHVREFEETRSTQCAVVLELCSDHGSERVDDALLSLACGVLRHLRERQIRTVLISAARSLETMTINASHDLDRALELLALAEAGPSRHPEAIREQIHRHCGGAAALHLLGTANRDGSKLGSTRDLGGGLSAPNWHWTVVDTEVARPGEFTCADIANGTPIRLSGIQR